MRKPRKIFVLDTSVILYDHSAINCFQEHDVAIPIQVLEELDNFKKGNDTKNFEAREVKFIIPKPNAKSSENEDVAISDPPSGKRTNPSIGSKWDKLRSAVDREAFSKDKEGKSEVAEEDEIEEGVRKFWPKAKIVLKYFAPSVGAAENNSGMPLRGSLITPMRPDHVFFTFSYFKDTRSLSLREKKLCGKLWRSLL